MNACQHQIEIDRLTSRCLAQPRSSMAGVMSSKMLLDDMKAACQAECADASPYRDLELHPTSREDAVALVARSQTGFLDIAFEGIADTCRALRDGARHLLRRRATADRPQ